MWKLIEIGPLLFNISLNDIFYFFSNIDIDYAGDNTPYATDINITSLGHISKVDDKISEK